MKKTRRTQAQRRAETRAAVLESACRLFGAKGYADTSLEEIAADCGMTIRAFLELCRDPEFRRIVLVDGPNVLGRERWATSSVTRTVTGLLSGPKGPGSAIQRELAARMLIGALTEAALAIAESDNPERAGRAAERLVAKLGRALGPERKENPR
jgi:hypothetical protein